MDEDNAKGTAGHQARGGYRPLRLVLTGFRGIRSGLGRDTLTLDLETLAGDGRLVAIAGDNGRGKTTVMDNLTPYMVMPSRAGADGLGAFSYYDHVYLPESQKELVWRHAGRTFRSNLVFRVNGKKKTEAFLFEQSDDGWRPVVLEDGTVSDGKVETYEHAVTQILGPQDTFFTSVFSAQGKRPLSAFKNAEIKTLLADLLGLEQVREQGAKAAEVVRQLKGGLGVVRQEVAKLDGDIDKLKRSVAELDGSAAAVAAAGVGKAAAAANLEAARRVLATVSAENDGAAETETRRAALVAENGRVRVEHTAAAARLEDEGRRLTQREETLARRVANRVQQHAARRAGLQRQLNSFSALLSLRGRVDWAARRQQLAKRIAELRQQRVVAAQAQVEGLERLRGQHRLLKQEVDSIEREAGQVALRQADLQRRFGLAGSVPCAGTDLQGRCQLLGDAREAQALLPSADAALAQFAERKRSALERAATIAGEMESLKGVAERRNRAEQLLELAQARARDLAALVARRAEVEQALAGTAAVEAELAAMPEAAPGQIEDETAERADIGEAKARLQAERQRLDVALAEALARNQAQLQQLPAPFDVARLDRARQGVTTAQSAVATADAAEGAAVRRNEQAKALHQQLAKALADKELSARRVAKVEEELAAWSLLAKCLSNDGLIALDIDDAGPTFSALANELLLACYGPRFTLQVITQSANGKGEMREDFDIVVHDGARDESKSLKLVSGGERVWINECLTRAIALYLAGNTGRRYGTLFSDEADGPLDPEHKRMFMDMKREVLRLGGYECEFYVTQTPELTGMADRVIDLDAMAMASAEAG